MSRDRKRQINWYQVNDGAAIARHLERMAAKGWFLEKAGNFGWTFRRGEPRAVRYTLTYFPAASVFDAGPTEGQSGYIDFCQAAGWEFAAAYGPIQYFRSGRADPVPIETDEAEKLRVTRRTMRKTLVLGCALLILSQLCCLWSTWESFRFSPLRAVSSPKWLAMMLVYTAFLLYLAAILADYFVWCFRSQRSVARGGPCVKVHTRARLWGGFALLAFMAAALLTYLPGEIADPKLRVILLYSLAGILAVLAGSQGAMRLMKRRGRSRKAVRTGFIVCVVVLSMAYAAGILPLLRAVSHLQGEADGPAFTITTDWGSQWPIYRDELPVTLEDLGYDVPEEEQCSYRAEEQRSLLASWGAYTQRAPNMGSSLPDLSYEVCAVRWDWLRQCCWEAVLRGSAGVNYANRLEPLPAGALEGRYAGYGHKYALLYPDRIILADAGWDWTQAQFDTLLDTLSATE